jgi:TolA-binding protein
MVLPGLLLFVFLGLWATRASSQDARTSAPASKMRRIPEGLNFAHGLFRQRKFDLAAEEYERFLDSRPAREDADEARFGLANARLFEGRYKEARQAFRDFLDKAPAHPRARTVWYRLGELSFILGDLPAARQALETFIAGSARHPNLETAWTYLGDVRFGLDDLAGARKAYERSLADFPQGQLVDRSRFGLGRALASLGQIDPALEAFKELTRRGSTDWIDRAWFQIGKIQLERGRYDEAVETFQTLDRLAPRSGLKSEAALLRAEALGRLDRGRDAEGLLGPLIAQGSEPLASRAALALATLQLERGGSQEALATLDDALKRFPQSPLVPSLLFRSAEALQKLKRGGEARRRFLKVATTDAHDPRAGDAVARAAQLAMEAGDHAEAIALARSFPERFPGSERAAEVRLIEARALRATGQAREAVRILEPLLRIGRKQEPAIQVSAQPLSPASAAAARYELALAYRATGQAAKAEALLAALSSATKDTVSADAQFLIGQERIEQGRFAEAIGPLTSYLSRNSGGDVADFALAHLATAQLGVGKSDQAWSTLKRLEDRFPHSKALLSTRLRLAEAALDADQAARAAEQFRLVLDASPAGGESQAGPGRPTPPAIDSKMRGRAQAGLGKALWKLGKPAEAADLFARFLETSGGEPAAPWVALDHAGALAAAGQTEAAMDAYRLAAQRYPKTREALQAELSQARLLVRTGHPDRAAAVFGALLSGRDKEAGLDALGMTRDALLAERGWALVDARKTAEADLVFGELLKTYPRSEHAIEARFNLAESASEAGNHTEVVRLLTPLVTSPSPASPGPAGKPAAAAPARILPLVLYRLGRTQIELEDWVAAEATLDRLVREYPDSSRIREARFLLAEAALRRDHFEAAEAALAALESGSPGAPDPDAFRRLVRLRHVQSLLGVRRWNDALTRADALLRELPAADPAIAELDFARGRALLGLARPNEARAAFKVVIDARKGGDLAAQAQLMRGETYFHESRFREALSEFLKVHVLYDAPRWQAAALLEAGKVYERLAQWRDAAESYERLCSEFPKDPRAAEARDRLEAARKQGSARAPSGGKVF